MSMSDGRADPRAGFCPKCGALNGADFNRCIRCGAAISTAAAGVDLARGHLDGRTLLGTKALLGVTIFVCALQLRYEIVHGQLQILPPSTGPDAIASAREALQFGAVLSTTDAVLAEPWRLLSAVFVHYGLLHFGMNMLGLANLGRLAEPAIGTARLVVAYVITGIAGFAGSVLYDYLVNGGHGGTTAGASGAVMGMMGVVLGWLLRRRDRRWKEWAVQAVFYSLLFGFLMRANNAAHIVGLLFGIAFGAAYAGSRPRSDLWANVAAAIGVLACIVSIILPHLSPLTRRLIGPPG